MSISISMVALDQGAKISSSAIRADLTSTWPSLPAPTNAEMKDDILAFRLGPADVFVALMPAPIPWSDLEGPCSTSWLWPDAATELRRHRAHALVTLSADCEPIERLTMLTQVTASLVATCEATVGVYWCDARLVMSPSMFREFAARMLPEGYPLYVWVDFRVGRNEEGKTSGFTTGMTALGHMELETLNSPEPPGELKERFFGLAYYLLENGPVIQDGDTIGEDANERIKVIYSKSAFGHKDRVMRLDYEAVARKKSWWRRR